MIATTTSSKLLDKQMPKTLTKALVITNQIEHTSDWKYIGSDIGIAIAWVMTSPNKKRYDMWWGWSCVCTNSIKNKPKFT